MKAEILNYLLGNLTIEFLIAFYLFALLGVFLSMLLHYKRAKKTIKTPFNFKYWITDNLVRFLTSFICIFVAIRFYDSLHIDIEPNMFFGLVIGVSLDQVIIIIRNKTSIKTFQK